ncbi:MAG: histone deacetylase [Candidatus Thorarchaeota archaeon]|nr:histone deacetylase [Candidatus Thorarchaeota archaeon]MCK5240114.1 histone deacetylase [Candidatus Thorarchaeota archaeon]
MNTEVIYHDMYTKHELSPGHPESPQRLITVLNHIQEAGLLESGKVDLVTPTMAHLDDIVPLHDASYLEAVHQKSQKGGGFFTLDTSVNRYTYDAALLAAGGGIMAVDRVAERTARNSFVLCRPPGHHAENSRAFGFCFINNIAVAAHYLIAKRDFKRILIVDYDAHHGNGTQNAFYDRDDVLYIGLHQDGRTLFPGSGFPDEIGTGNGKGYNVNLSMYPGAGDISYSMAFDDIIEPIADSFQPDMVLTSVGFDAHFEDPLTHLGLTTAGLSLMNTRLIEIAKKHSEDRIVFFLEGGYNLGAMGCGGLNLVEALSHNEITEYGDMYQESEICTARNTELVTFLKDNLREYHF